MQVRSCSTYSKTSLHCCNALRIFITHCKIVSYYRWHAQRFAAEPRQRHTKVRSGITVHPGKERLFAGHAEMRLAMHDAPPRDFDGRTDGDRAELGQWSMAPRAVRQVRARAVRGHRSSSYP